MRKLYSGILVFVLVLSLFIGNKTNVSAAESTDNNIIYARLINNETGEVTTYNMDDITLKTSSVNSSAVQTYRTSATASTSTTYEITLPLPSSTGISTYSSSSGSKKENYVTASGTIVYTRSGDYITVSKCYGSWSPSLSTIYMSNREVWLHSGVPAGKSLSKTPSSNTFSYTTGWAQTLYYPSSSISGPRLFTSAVARISGMTATYTIELLVLA
ncbi:MAG: hypothetical protein ACK5ML_01125 [Lachnospiraceae bacterium]